MILNFEHSNSFKSFISELFHTEIVVWFKIFSQTLIGDGLEKKSLMTIIRMQYFPPPEEI